jgi:hypothetical protein
VRPARRPDPVWNLSGIDFSPWNFWSCMAQTPQAEAYAIQSIRDRGRLSLEVVKKCISSPDCLSSRVWNFHFDLQFFWTSR